MKDLIKFLLFIIYSTSIFLLPNNKLIMIFFIFNFLLIYIKKLEIKKIIEKSIKISAFIFLVFIINCLLDNFTNAMWITIKLFIVCNITIVYSNTVTITRNSRNNKNTIFSI